MSNVRVTACKQMLDNWRERWSEGKIRHALFPRLLRYSCPARRSLAPSLVGRRREDRARGKPRQIPETSALGRPGQTRPRTRVGISRRASVCIFNLDPDSLRNKSRISARGGRANVCTPVILWQRREKSARRGAAERGESIDRATGRRESEKVKERRREWVGEKRSGAQQVRKRGSGTAASADRAGRRGVRGSGLVWPVYPVPRSVREAIEVPCCTVANENRRRHPADRIPVHGPLAEGVAHNSFPLVTWTRTRLSRWIPGENKDRNVSLSVRGDRRRSVNQNFEEILIKKERSAPFKTILSCFAASIYAS